MRNNFGSHVWVGPFICLYFQVSYHKHASCLNGGKSAVKIHKCHTKPFCPSFTTDTGLEGALPLVLQSLSTY